MNTVSRRLLFSALMFAVLLGACSLPTGVPATPVGTILPTGQMTDTPLATQTGDLTTTPLIPITGMEVVSLQCQFCVNEEAHAVLIMSNQASFNVSEAVAGVNCLIAQDVNDRRILLCRGPQTTTFNLNVCIGDANCLQFPITLQTCPLVPESGTGVPIVTFTPLTPIFLTPILTFVPPSDTPGPSQPTSTPTSATTPATQPPPTSTTVPPTSATSTPEPPTPTEEEATQPPPTDEPATDPPPTTESVDSTSTEAS